jgi:hypothetical protein
MTYDGAALRLYLNGVQISSLARTGNIVTSTNPLQIGGDSIYGQYFAGMIDEVRIYNVALTQAQIQADMDTPIGNPPPDAEPPTAPGNLRATAVGGSQISLTWAASTDNFGLSSYLVEGCQGAGCTNFVQIGSPTGIGTTYFDTDLTGNTTYSYQVRATDWAGNLSPYSNVASATTQAGAIASDNFNRSNGSLGVNWAKPIASENNMVIISNQAGVDVENSHNYAYWATNSFSDNQYSQITLGNIGPWIGVILRADSTSDRFYMGFVFGATDYRIYIRWDGAYYEVAKVVDGNLSCDPNSVCQMLAPGQTWQAGDVLRLEMTGDTKPISAVMSRNGVQVLSWANTVAGPVKTGGNPGIGIYSPSGQHLALDNWEGGNID